MSDRGNPKEKEVWVGTGMDLEMGILSNISKKEKDKYLMIPLIRGILENDTNALIYKTGKLSHR